MSFIHDDFLLNTKTGRRLYQRFACGEPILDYHCHLPPKDVASNRRFQDLFEIWLEGDHYKWRAMRADGIDERYCTGDASHEEKFLAWARTVPLTITLLLAARRARQHTTRAKSASMSLP